MEFKICTPMSQIILRKDNTQCKCVFVIIIYIFQNQIIRLQELVEAVSKEIILPIHLLTWVNSVEGCLFRSGYLGMSYAP